MKHSLLALSLLLASVNSHSATIFFAARGPDNAVLATALLSSTFAATLPLQLIFIADNGDAYIDMNSAVAQEALKLAVQKVVDGEELSSEDKAIIEIYAQGTGLSESEIIEKVSAEL